jgi:hypothetical protein
VKAPTCFKTGLTEEDQLTLLDLLVKCLSIPWNSIKKRFQVLQNESEQPAAVRKFFRQITKLILKGRH